MGRRRRIHLCLMQSVALIVVTSATVSVANAQANTNGANVNALNLLAPFLTLSTTPIGQETLQTGLQTVIAINNGATPAQQALAISDITRDLTTGTNLAGGSGTAQPVGGFGSMLGPIYVTGINASALPATVNLLTNAIMATEADLGLAKYYFANGTISNGGPPAVAPPGYTLPTFNGLPNSINSVYDLAYGVTQPGRPDLL
jgi:subtilase-type serine protease